MMIFTNVFSQAERISYSKFRASLPLYGIKSTSLIPLLDTAIYYVDRCALIKEKVPNATHHLVLWAKSKEQLGITYELWQHYYEMQLRWLNPEASFFYKGKLFFVDFFYFNTAIGETDSTKIGERELISQKFDELFYSMDTTYVLTYDMDKFKYLLKEEITHDGLTINFLEDANGFIMVSKTPCIENKRDFYVKKDERSWKQKRAGKRHHRYSKRMYGK